MKRFVLLVATVLICCHPAFSRSAKDVIRIYSQSGGVEAVSIDKTTFNMVKLLIPMDRQTKKLLNLLNPGTMDIVSPKKGGNLDLKSMISDLKALSGQDSYSEIKDDGNSGENGGMIIRSDGRTINEMVIYSFSPSTGELLLMRIDCNADMEKISKLLES